MALVSEFKKLDSSGRSWDELLRKIAYKAHVLAEKKKLTTEVAIGDMPNIAKNRYTNVLPYDQHRIILKSSKNADRGYINASPVTVPEANRRYILTQGPIEDSTADFWRMVWENKVTAIAMLNKVIEGNSKKCEKYFPSSKKSTMSFEEFTIRLESEEDCEYFIIRHLILSATKEIDRKLVHIQFTEWPDFGVPASTSHFLELLNAMKARNLLTENDSDPPVVVHCSAGIGRSGTFVLIDAVLRMVELGVSQSDISIKDLLVNLRSQRMGLIQTPGQLQFAWKAIVDGITATSKGAGDSATVGDTILKKRKSESQDVDDRSSKRRNFISRMVAKNRETEEKRKHKNPSVRVLLSGGAVAAAAILSFYLYRNY